ncbi:TonB-dependent receptor [Hymenobacter terrestris]|uniref:Carboxypeptidase-like regulatory domain-containing protein n=1 Tax=Hymenobacter terrestris TaxID=2748310 RepID=A0ABX2PXP1_9BACT|nr:TonB-dependent receptor [Hymenobacter terrestris]NVO83455.1 carboxypeptidase-like regulatory domain-containing protein [Hymenobacter terrestris]
MQRTLILFFLLITSSLAWAQQATLSGTIRDKKTGEGAIGATVIITGTTQAAPVELDGTYRLLAAPGTYTISVQSIGYKPLTFPGTVLREGQTTTLNGSLEESSQSLGEVVVTGQKQTGTEVALLQDLKKSEVVVSGMSSDQIVKTLDRDAAEVVKRIPGVTIQNNTFVVVRGLSERYNTVMLNDAITPSAEVDTRSFSFDILPSSVIDRILVFKSGSPELPGEFGGGVVKVYTKNSVLDNTTSFSVSSSYRSGTTFRNDYLTSGTPGWLGYDKGNRGLPSGIPGQITPGTTPNNEIGNTLRQINNRWLPNVGTAAPDLRASLGLTRRFEVGNTYFSNVTSLSYSNTHQQYNIERNRYLIEVDPATGQPAAQYKYNDERAVTGTRLGVIHNWQARINDNNRLEFRNFLNQYGTDEVVHRTGEELSDGQERDDYALHYQSRTIYSGQLQGFHDLGAAKRSTITWLGGYNYVYRNEPDYSRYRNVRATGLDRPFAVNIPNGGNPFDASRFYSDLRENTYTASGQWERRFTGRDTTKANEFKLRIGFYAEQKDRDLQNRYFSFIRGNDFFKDRTRANRLSLLPIDQIFAPENLDPLTGFTLAEGTSPEDRYNAENTLLAGYVGVVAPLTDKLNLSGGVRVEYNRKFLRDGNPSREPYEEKRTIPMPSLNLTYNFTQRSLLRLAGSVTVNRPEFREVAEYDYFDFTTNAIIRGDQNLKTATIYNGDLRYEFYPSRSEMISFAVFYKHFDQAIEQVTRQVSGSQLYLTYTNADRAYDVGAELEVRKSLIDISQSRVLQRFSMVLNASLIRSRVNLAETDETVGFALFDRPLQGQSPYVVNAGVFYQDDDHKWQVSAQYNVIGQRIAFVGDQRQNYSVIEMPRNIIDLSVTKGFGKHLQLRAGIQDIINQSVRQYYDFDRNGKISKNEDGPFARYKLGNYSTLGLTYQF